VPPFHVDANILRCELFLLYLTIGVEEEGISEVRRMGVHEVRLRHGFALLGVRSKRRVCAVRVRERKLLGGATDRDGALG